MPNAHGDFIWYELMTGQPDAAKLFYDDVCGWKIGPKPDQGMDYRMIETASGAVGGVLTLAPDAVASGAMAGWFAYLAVDDVDAAADKLKALGGQIFLKPWDIPGVGRVAFVSDPQGAHFYLMRGASDQTSTVFAPATPGQVSWNELTTSDMPAALDFYGELFGWTKGETMPMGDIGDYQFLEHGGQMIGAMMQSLPNSGHPRWTFAFEVPDILAARTRVIAGQGRPMEEPVEVPGGGFAMACQDPEGLSFYLSGPKQGDAS